jgi:hypothetical protein
MLSDHLAAGAGIGVYLPSLKYQEAGSPTAGP